MGLCGLAPFIWIVTTWTRSGQDLQPFLLLMLGFRLGLFWWIHGKYFNGIVHWNVCVFKSGYINHGYYTVYYCVIRFPRTNNIQSHLGLCTSFDCIIGKFQSLILSSIQTCLRIPRLLKTLFFVSFVIKLQSLMELLFSCCMFNNYVNYLLNFFSDFKFVRPLPVLCN